MAQEDSFVIRESLGITNYKDASLFAVIDG